MHHQLFLQTSSNSYNLAAERALGNVLYYKRKAVKSPYHSGDKLFNLREIATATLSTPPIGRSSFFALGPNSFTRKSAPCALNRALKKAAVSSTGGRTARNGLFN